MTLPITDTTPWIGVDLDGTLAMDSGWKSIAHIGDPVPTMVERIKGWLAEGKCVKVFTARAQNPDAIPYIDLWTQFHIGQKLPVTCEKDQYMEELWDDRARGVERNTGEEKTPSMESHPVLYKEW